LKTGKTKKINIITLGCSKNLVDSERLLKQLKSSNYSVSHDSDEPSDIIVVNTCGFINDAKQESIDTILNCLEAKRNALVKKVFVMGCLSERYKSDLKNELIDVDGFYGVAELEQIVKDLDATYKKELLSERILTTPQHYAYLKIAEGCNRKCSFCAIPLIRGKFISKPIESLIKEAKSLVTNGVKEILLIAQDLTYYGVDLYKESRLTELLDRLSLIHGLKWIRLHYTYPIHFSDKLLKLINDRPNICKYIDIPLQHISDSILKSMKRGVTGKEQRDLVQRIKKYISNAAIRTTMIVGYPGETEADFEKLKDFIQEIKFERLGVFTYSSEEDTVAYQIEDNVPEEVKNARMEELMELQQQISLNLNEQKVNKIYKVIIDRKEGEFFVGRTEFDSPEVDNEVLIPIKSDCRIGEFYDVKVISASPFDLYAKIVS
jgi:ribosomal protein S12 methylthiotransferase